MTDLKTAEDKKRLFQNLRKAKKALQATKKSLRETNVDDDVFDRIIEIKEKAKELVDSLKRSG